MPIRQSCAGEGAPIGACPRRSSGERSLALSQCTPFVPLAFPICLIGGRMVEYLAGAPTNRHGVGATHHVEGSMSPTRWFDGFTCTKCGFLLLCHEDQSRCTACYAPAGPLLLQCPNPACRHQQDYAERPPEKFCLLSFRE